jgi:NADH:ubiquinone oxidoreductase subunit 5 (subunit L)/multisubunit Na+/H+ antiporter MnhA subunit
MNVFKAGIKVLIINRIGDFFFLFSIMFILFFFETTEFSVVFNLVLFLQNYFFSFFFFSLSIVDLVSFFILIAVVCKSAQIGFHIWLIEAMEAPLPASSLIHSATLVCAGVFFFFRVAPLLVESNLSLVILGFWSSLSALCMSIIACFHYDIKKILAYSTSSHIGFMLTACVTFNFSGCFFYLISHATAKVLLFLIFGYVIDFCFNIRDLRRMGGLLLNLNFLSKFFIVASLSLAGLPLCSIGYLKDLVVYSFLNGFYFNDFFFSFLSLAAFFTYFYIFRVFFFIFFGDRLGALKNYFRQIFIFILLYGNFTGLIRV